MKQTLTIAALLLGGMLSAQNPLITHMYTADPTARVFDGKLYLYPSSDQVPPEGVDIKYPFFCMPGYHSFTLENGSTWRDNGWILKENDVPWGDKDQYAMWAPDCIEKDGKYYYYFPAKPKSDSAFRRIGMGVADKPEGPFKWEETFIEGVTGIDPGLMVDDDNQAYLFYGGGEELYVAPLSDDMKSIKEPPTAITTLPVGWKEGAFPFKKEGKYYLTFAHFFEEEGYTIGYAVSDSPMGPYTYYGKIMDNIDDPYGTNHHSVVKYKDQWILFYHYWHISGINKLRSVCADYMTFTEKGRIERVKPTLRGIGNPTIGDTIQIDRTDEVKDAQITFVSGDEPNGWMISEARSGATVRFTGVDFGDGSATKMIARMASAQHVGRVDVHCDTPEGELIATFPIHFTGGWGKWQDVEADIQTKLTGIHDICMVFRWEDASAKMANINWLLLK